MPEEAVASERLDSWKEIAAYLGRNERTVVRWEKEKGLPIHRIPGGQRQSVFAYRDELDEWLGTGSRERSLNKEPKTPLEVSPATVEIAPEMLQSRSRFRISGRGVIFAVALIGTGVAAHYWYSVSHGQEIQFTGISQITNDGTRKLGLVSDGSHIYFDEFRDGKTILASVSVSGGTVKTISTFLSTPTPQAVSQDGRELLVLNQDGKEEERSVWIVPVSGAMPKRVGDMRCHSAAWDSQESRIAFATGNAIFLTSDEGRTNRLVHEFAAIPERLQWSLKTDILQFQLRAVDTGKLTLWQLQLSGKKDARMTSLTPLNVEIGQQSPYVAILNESNEAFVSASDLRDGKIRFLGKEFEWLGSRLRLRDVGVNLSEVGKLVLDRNSHKLFALSGIPPVGEILLYSPDSRITTPFLAGISARDIDFSKDGQWITYVKLTDQSLWESRSDGNNAREIHSPAVDTELPRWSPDGRQIAFISKITGKPWRIYLISPAGGEAREASIGTDNQGAPTWSPDGKWLAYGNVRCQEAGTCSIHKIELSTMKEVIVPDSEGFATARWSPNGRYIGALRPDRHEVHLFDLKTGRWHKIAEEATGDDLAWSRDSRYLYASRPVGERPKIIRIGIEGGRVESVVDLSSLSQMSGSIDSWFGITPDGSILLSHKQDAAEIYALSFVER